ncbi:hypothetical protein TNCV_4874621 [Trichonephila clavipes]|nr:hypothetical protein TNCV_4874621 [Trichonephila clavipes]
MRRFAPINSSRNVTHQTTVKTRILSDNRHNLCFTRIGRHAPKISNNFYGTVKLSRKEMPQALVKKKIAKNENIAFRRGKVMLELFSFTKPFLEDEKYDYSNLYDGLRLWVA